RRIETSGGGGCAQMHDGVRPLDRRRDAALVGEIPEHDLHAGRPDDERPTAEEPEAMARGRELGEERRPDEAARSRDQYASHVCASSWPPGAAGPSAPWRTRPNGSRGSSP